MERRRSASVDRRRPVLPQPRAERRPVARTAGRDDVFRTWASYDQDPVCVVEDRAGRRAVTWANRSCGRLLGCAEPDLTGTPFAALWAREEPPALDPVRAVRVAATVQRRDGSQQGVVVTATPVGGPDEDAWVLRLVPDLDLLRLQQELAASQERFQALADTAPVGILVSEHGLRLGYVNDTLCHVLGRSAAQLLGTDWLSAVVAEDLEPLLAALQETLAGAAAELPLRVHQADGALRSLRLRLVPVRHGREARFFGLAEDVTEGLARERQLAHQATHDALTGLANRRALIEGLDRALADGVPVALALLDLDGFKAVNDTHGHEAGDALLRAVAERLADGVRTDDLVARLGGDEFAVLARGVPSEADAALLGGRLLPLLEAPLADAALRGAVSCSTGIAVSSPTSTSADLLREADAAMYRAKASGKRGVVVFDGALRSELARRSQLVHDLRAALLTGEDLWVAYQPLVGVVSGTAHERARVEGVEALLRWSHPVHGDVPPAEFVPLAEEHGLVEALGRLVLDRACGQLRAWDDALDDRAPARVSVNVSPVQLRAAGFADEVTGVLAAHGLDGARLCLEVTESAVMQDVQASAALLGSLRARGVRVALDDFGTGYSSLALLDRLPVDELKVDRSFLGHLEGDGARLVAAVVGLGGALGLEVVAEGVETVEQLGRLVDLGCPLAQGYLFSRPLPPDRLADEVLAVRP